MNNEPLLFQAGEIWESLQGILYQVKEIREPEGSAGKTALLMKGGVGKGPVHTRAQQVPKGWRRYRGA